MSISLLRTKLHTPSLSAKRVARPHIIQKLNEGLAAGHLLTLVSAPAGFGKTTCVNEWINGLPGMRVGWLSLDASDDDPGRFFTYFFAALRSISEKDSQDLEEMLLSGQLPPLELLVTTTINHILQFDTQAILALDDFHLVQHDLILKFFEKLLANLPPTLHLILLTREDPQLPLARLRANDRLTEIRADDLRFSTSEAGCYLNELMALSLTTDDIAALDERTEGWVVGLQLAGLSMRGRSDLPGFIANLSGSHRYILSYLTEEVLSRQPEAVQTFLLETSLLDRLNGDLCAAVTGRPDSSLLLEQLYTANLFLIPLDDEQRWYRYHHLFADLLANRLKQVRSADEIQGLHCKASDWMAQNGFVDEAIQHALEGKDYTRAASLVDQVARSLIFSDRLNTLRSWLVALPPACLAANPRLEIYRVWIDLLQGKADLSEAALQEKEDLLKTLPSSPENDALRTELTVVLCRFLPLLGDTARTIRLAQEALAVLPKEDLVSRARLIFVSALAYGLDGIDEKENEAYQDSLRLAQAAGDDVLIARILSMMAQSRLPYGQLHAAAGYYRSVIELGNQPGRDVFYPAGQGYLGLASIYLEWNDLVAAEEYLRQGTELCARGGLDGIYNSYLVRARYRQVRGDFQGAFNELDRLEQVFPRNDDLFRIERQIQVQRAMKIIDGIDQWIALLDSLLSPQAGKAKLPIGIIQLIQVILARAYLAQDKTEQALAILNELRSTVEPAQYTGHMIEFHLLTAMGYQSQHKKTLASKEQGRTSAHPLALQHFRQALELAEPEGYVWLFVEEGTDVFTLLAAVIRDATTPEQIKKYASKLQEVFLIGETTTSEPEEIHNEPAPAPWEEQLIEPLTKRELEVLELISRGCSNQEIAGRLFITVSAVKKHTSNIIGKLNVNNRTQAVAHARQLKLLP